MKIKLKLKHKCMNTNSSAGNIHVISRGQAHTMRRKDYKRLKN